jgi:hypothetical protein
MDIGTHRAFAPKKSAGLSLQLFASLRRPVGVGREWITIPDERFLRLAAFSQLPQSTAVGMDTNRLLSGSGEIAADAAFTAG